MRTLSRSPEIEPLSPEAWKRVEKGLFDALERPDNPSLPTVSRPAPSSWRRPALAIGLLAAAVTVAFVISRPPPSSNGLNGLTRIETTDAPVELVFAGSKITVAPHSAALYGNGSGTVQVVLQNGAVHCKVAPRKRGEHFVVHAADVVVNVVGTEFDVTRADRDVSVSVQEGQVEVCRGADCSYVQGDKTWPPAVVTTTLNGPKEPTIAQRARKKKIVKKSPSIWQTRYTKAQGLEVDEPDTAIEHYEAIAAGPDESWSALSMYSLGLLYAKRGDKDNARAWWNRYLETYPHGANASDVKLDLGRL